MEESAYRSKVKWYHHIGDFANLFKAFIGTNYLSIAYGFKQSGLGFGVLMLVVISALTCHCCQLIVKCKMYLVNDICNEYLMKRSTDSDADTSIDEDVSILRKRLEKNLSYTDISRLTLGKWGAFLVDFFLVITQIGFCVGYFIFIGNTAYSFFPFEAQNTMSSSIQTAMKSDFYLNQHPPFISKDAILLPNRTIKDWSPEITKPSFISNPTGKNVKQPGSVNRLVTEVSPGPALSSGAVTQSNATHLHNTTTVLVSTAPSLYLLVLAPLPIFILLTYFRRVRQMSIISVLANTSIFIGFIAILLYIALDFRASSTFTWFEFGTLPVCIGQLLGAFEAIGTIIPVQASMEGNRHRFPKCLLGVMIVFTGVLGTLGILGYLQYGAYTEQIIGLNLPAGDAIVILINVTLMIGVLFTYPLQVFPVIEIFEGMMFTEGKLCGPPAKNIDLESSDDVSVEEALLLNKESDSLSLSLPVATHVPKSVAAWKRNLFRSLVALFVCAIAIGLRNVFAYVGALVGSIGSCPLMFVLPCLLHYKIRKGVASKCILFKDIVIMIFGCVAGIISFVVVIQEIIDKV